jgi:hypothetical protein
MVYSNTYDIEQKEYILAYLWRFDPSNQGGRNRYFAVTAEGYSYNSESSDVILIVKIVLTKKYNF